MIIILDWFVLFEHKKGSLLGVPRKRGVGKLKKLRKLEVGVRVCEPQNKMRFFSCARLHEHMMFFKIPLLPIVSIHRFKYWGKRDQALLIRTSDFYFWYKGRWSVMWRKLFKRFEFTKLGSFL